MQKEIKDWTESDIKRWISKNKVLFFTNTRCMPGSIFLSSILTYTDYIPVSNFQIVHGERAGRPFYGFDVFFEMSKFVLGGDFYLKNYDFAVYIDEDCFVTDFNALMEEIVDFVESEEFCMAGPQDGGMICHRNHSRYLFNTYVSFWNFKMLREKTNLKEFTEIMRSIIEDRQRPYQKFMEMMREKQPDLLGRMNALSSDMLIRGKCFRNDTFPMDAHGRHESPYAGTVRNDKTNPIEPNQIPYSYKDDELGNFEPYYLVEEAWVLSTGRPIKYLFHSDLYIEGEESKNTDNSGLSSALYCDNRLAVVHTWFSRAYTKWPQNALESMHTARINKIIIKYGVL